MGVDIPKHVAIVMDGNGRWAERRRHPRVFGHIKGSARVKEVVREADRLGVKALTLYAFSTENWLRPESERRVLWRLLKKYLIRDAEELDRENIRLRVIGEMDRLDFDVRSVLEATLTRLSKNTGLQLTFALSYGSRRELARAAQLFAEDCLSGKVLPSAMADENFLNRYLWTTDLGELGNVDLFIRTSGEKRISNFLLWQSAYAELLFVNKCWPDFRASDLAAAVREYAQRDRRFGALGLETKVDSSHSEQPKTLDWSNSPGLKTQNARGVTGDITRDVNGIALEDPPRRGAAKAESHSAAILEGQHSLVQYDGEG